MITKTQPQNLDTIIKTAVTAIDMNVCSLFMSDSSPSGTVF